MTPLDVLRRRVNNVTYGEDVFGNRALVQVEALVTAAREAQSAFAYTATSLEGTIAKREHAARHMRFNEGKLADVLAPFGQPEGKETAT